MFRKGLRPPDPFRDQPPLRAAQTQDGMSVDALSRLAPLLVVCLPARADRWLAAVAAQRAAVEGAGARLVLVHAADTDFAAHDLQYVARVADPERLLYAHFELEVKPRSLLRRSPTQLPGAAVVRDGAVGRVWRAPSPRTAPPLAELVRETPIG